MHVDPIKMKRNTGGSTMFVDLGPADLSQPRLLKGLPWASQCLIRALKCHTCSPEEIGSSLFFSPPKWELWGRLRAAAYGPPGPRKSLWSGAQLWSGLDSPNPQIWISAYFYICGNGTSTDNEGQFVYPVQTDKGHSGYLITPLLDQIAL